MIEAYPLAWPAGYPRTRNPVRNYHFYQTTFAKERDALLRELKLLKAADVVLSTNIPLRQDGLPYADWQKKSVTDYGVAVYFKFQGTPSVLCCDAWDLIEDNVHAIGKTVDAMRGIDRWKVSEVLKRTFTGFKALPETTQAGEEIWQTLELKGKPSLKKDVEDAFKRLAKIYHPDLPTGDSNRYYLVNDAYQKALKFF